MAFKRCNSAIRNQEIDNFKLQGHGRGPQGIPDPFLYMKHKHMLIRRVKKRGTNKRFLSSSLRRVLPNDLNDIQSVARKEGTLITKEVGLYLDRRNLITRNPYST